MDLKNSKETLKYSEPKMPPYEYIDELMESSIQVSVFRSVLNRGAVESNPLTYTDPKYVESVEVPLLRFDVPLRFRVNPVVLEHNAATVKSAFVESMLLKILPYFRAYLEQYYTENLKIEPSAMHEHLNADCTMTMFFSAPFKS